MTKRIPQPRCELSPGVRAHEARLLAAMLRTSRLTWVFAEPGADKSALLKDGVMPLLQRRRSDSGRPDAAVPAAAGPALPRERRRARQRQRRELAIYFDAWGDAPLALLKRRLLAIAPVAPAAAVDEAGDDSFAALLQHLAQQQLQFVFVFDRFEAYLAQPPGDAGVAQFANELIEAIAAQASSDASFLIALDESARPRLERFRSRLPGFDHDVLRLSPVAAPAEPMPWLPSEAHAQAAPPPPRHGPPPRTPIKVEDVYALIESTLARSRAQQHPADEPCGAVRSPAPGNDLR